MKHKRLSYPTDLAILVLSKLKEMHVRAPAFKVLEELLELALFASMKTEEAEKILCTLVYIDSKNPDPRPPSRIVADRWSYVRFHVPIPLNLKNLVKMSKSLDSAHSALAVYRSPSGGLEIWGAIDQQNHRIAYISQESDVGSECPGLFQVCVTGVGVIEVYKNYTMVGALRQGYLTCGFNDVLAAPGPIQHILQAEIDRLVQSVWMVI